MVGGYAHLRWRKQVRELADGANWYWLRRELKRALLDFVGSEKEVEMEAFRMASGGDANWRRRASTDTARDTLQVARGPGYGGEGPGRDR